LRATLRVLPNSISCPAKAGSGRRVAPEPGNGNEKPPEWFHHPATGIIPHPIKICRVAPEKWTY
jgi:hypothetical protein